VSLCDSSDESVLKEGSGVRVPSDLDEGGRSEGRVGGDGETELASEVDERSVVRREKKKRKMAGRVRDGENVEGRWATYC